MQSATDLEKTHYTQEDVATRAKDRPSSAYEATLGGNGGEEVRVTSVKDGHDTVE